MFKEAPVDQFVRKQELDKLLAADQLNKQSLALWTAPDTSTIATDSAGLKIKYGRALIAHTSKYLGPNGTVAQISNGMNCQNCHLDAGTRPWGNNYAAVSTTYPKYRARSGMIENIYKRVNDCLERSLNGRALDTASREMQAIKAYIEWVGKDVKKVEKPKGSGIFDLAFLNRPADKLVGEKLFAAKCQSCHQPQGSGLLNDTKKEYTYPPLWGNHSYNIGAGLFRISRLAGYIKYKVIIPEKHGNKRAATGAAFSLICSSRWRCQQV